MLKSGWSAVVKNQKGSASAPVSPSQRQMDFRVKHSDSSPSQKDGIGSLRSPRDRETLRIGESELGKGNKTGKSPEMATVRHHSADLPSTAGASLKGSDSSSPSQSRVQSEVQASENLIRQCIDKSHLLGCPDCQQVACQHFLALLLSLI